MPQKLKSFFSSFLNEYGTLIDLGGTATRPLSQPIIEVDPQIWPTSDTESIRSDWNNIGSELQSALDIYHYESVSKK